MHANGGGTPRARRAQAEAEYGSNLRAVREALLGFGVPVDRLGGIEERPGAAVWTVERFANEKMLDLTEALGAFALTVEKGCVVGAAQARRGAARACGGHAR